GAAAVIQRAGFCGVERLVSDRLYPCVAIPTCLQLPAVVRVIDELLATPLQGLNRTSHSRRGLDYNLRVSSWRSNDRVAADDISCRQRKWQQDKYESCSDDGV